MIRKTLSALFFIAATSISTGLMAQTVYRCGDTYSQTPCAGGNPVDTRDTRTRSQQMQTESNAQRDARAAKSLETSRKKEEDSQLKTQRSTQEKSKEKTQTNMGSAASGSGSGVHKKDSYFTARSSDDAKKKKPGTGEKKGTEEK